MSVTTTDLAAWLTQIWDEEERLATKATQGAWEAERLPERWDGDRPAYWVKFESADDDGGSTSGVTAECPWGMTDAVFIASHDPAAVLARIAADRKILARCMRIWSEDEDGRPLAELVRAVDAGLIVHDLASGYADRPGYPMERP